MSHPLVSGFGTPPPFRATISLDPPPPGTCFESIEDIRKWIESALVEVVAKRSGLVLGTSGTLEGAPRSDRDKLRAVFDDQGRFHGWSVFGAQTQEWSLQGVPGELKTILRSESSVDADMKTKGLGGWFLCDGSVPGAPDFTATDDRFAGTAPDWDIYTVIRLT